jgi:hypothetical protein
MYEFAGGCGGGGAAAAAAVTASEMNRIAIFDFNHGMLQGLNEKQFNDDDGDDDDDDDDNDKNHNNNEDNRNVLPPINNKLSQ